MLDISSLLPMKKKQTIPFLNILLIKPQNNLTFKVYHNPSNILILIATTKLKQTKWLIFIYVNLENLVHNS